MKIKWWLLCDREWPHRYMVSLTQGEILGWRNARERLDPDARYDLARMSFSDWCSRYGL